MSYLLVETLGSRMLVHPTGAVVFHHRPTVVPNTDWVGHQIALNHLRVLAALGENATDQEWAEWLRASEGDVDLARDSYLSKLRGPPPEPAPAPVSEPEPVVARKGRFPKS